MFSNILIVDDSETSRMIIKKCLMMTGHEGAHFSEAEDGIMALTILSENTIDLVVTDLNMPRMDGVTLVKKLRKSEKMASLPVLVISSLGNDVLEAELVSLGVKGIIRKPLTPNKISEIFQGAFHA